MRDRLIDILKKFTTDSCRVTHQCGYCDYGDLVVCASAVAEHILKNGVIVPPCNIGDTLYYPVFATNRVLLYKVISIKLNSKGLYVVCENCLSKSQMTHRTSQIGKTIFLTEKEAEWALVEVANGT